MSGDSYWDGRLVTDLVAHPELEPELGPTREALANGAEPDNALSPHADAEIIDPPEWVDELDVNPSITGPEAEAEL